MGKRRDRVYWNVPVSRSLDEAVEEAIKRDGHVTKSDLIRDAVREMLRRMGFQI